MHIRRNAMEAMNEIIYCQTEEEVLQLSAEVVRSTGCESFVYTTMRADDRRPEQDTYRYFIGCRSEWCDVYSGRKWFMNDPFVEYARTNTCAIVGSQIKAGRTSGQLEMLEAAAEHGFRSGMILPTHSSLTVGERMGILYIGIDAEEAIGEPVLHANRITFRALGMELLDWWIARLYNEGRERYKLTEVEVEVLQHYKNGLRAAEIAAKKNVKTYIAYGWMSAIKEKMDVDKIDDAVRMANNCGLLG
ncbi:MAG: autoinducer binding domain-containing protein [Glaciimonas sp.]|nr:autoinducer binding domain-containing protein [Glaciimonas sp.]